MEPKPRGAWLRAEEVRFVVAGGVTAYYGVACASECAPTDKTRGYACDLNFDMCRTKARAELAERLVLKRLGGRLRNSNGMAAHQLLEEAMRHAVLELYERHCVLLAWHRELPLEEFHPEPHVHRALQPLLALARSFNATVRAFESTDPTIGVPAILCVLVSEEHAGILTSSAASASYKEALDSAYEELLKQCIYSKLIARRSPFAHRPLVERLESPEDHEAAYASPDIEPEATAFLRTRLRWADRHKTTSDIRDLTGVAKVEDLTLHSPDPSEWKVVRASSEQLVALEFGAHRGIMHRDLLRFGFSETQLAARPHPIG